MNRKSLCILFATFFFVQDLAAQCQVLYSLNAGDCLNCNQLIYTVNSKYEFLQHVIAFRSQDVDKAVRIEKLFKFSQLKNCKVVFDDSLFEKYNLNNQSTIAIVSAKNHNSLYAELFKNCNFYMLEKKLNELNCSVQLDSSKFITLQNVNQMPEGTDTQKIFKYDTIYSTSKNELLANTYYELSISENYLFLINRNLLIFNYLNLHDSGMHTIEIEDNDEPIIYKAIIGKYNDSTRQAISEMKKALPYLQPHIIYAAESVTKMMSSYYLLKYRYQS
jgi:hypothetical protein